MNEFTENVLLVIAGYCLAKGVAGLKSWLLWEALKRKIAEAEEELTVGDLLDDEEEEE